MYIGSMYAFFNDIEYAVWVEQDCLIHGDGIIDRAVENMGDADFSMGLWQHKLKLETCFIVFRTGRIFDIWKAFKEEASPFPELRYHALTQKFKFRPLPFGVGRARPIPWSDQYYYAQQLTDEEIEKFSDHTKENGNA
jgi:hypothetical protein